MQAAPPTAPGYELLSLLGSGGAARVWRARRTADNLLVALKVVDLGPGEVSGALREAAVLSRVRHPHVLHLYDVVPLDGDDGRPAGVALAVQLAAGGSLAQVLAARDHLTPGEVVTALAPLAAALADLHAVGVVHGDVSAGNVLFLSDGMPMLSDLGVCRIAGEPAAATHGTDGMVAPELVEGLAPSAESDVYAVGALAWQCLVGRPPGWVGTRAPLVEMAPGLPEALREIVTACLAPEPDDRPEADEVAAALFDAARPEPLKLAPGADPALGLTQRLREEVNDPAPSHERPVRRLHPWAVTRGRRGRRGPGLRAQAAHRARAGERTAGPERGDRWSVRGTWWWRATAAVVVLLGLMQLGVPAVRQAAAWLLEPAPAPTSTTTSTSQSPSTAVALAPSGPAGSSQAAELGAGEGSSIGAAESPAAASAGGEQAPPSGAAAMSDPSRDPAAAVQGLVDARAAAWVSGEPDDLAAVHAPGSMALAADAADLQAAAARGWRYEGVGFTVVEATVARVEDRRVVVEAQVDRSAFRVVGADESRSQPAKAEDVTLDLRLTDAGWRIWSWS